jgi:hypothetical protein
MFDTNTCFWYSIWFGKMSPQSYLHVRQQDGIIITLQLYSKQIQKVAYGGEAPSGVLLNDVVVFDVATNTWLTMNADGPAPPSGRSFYGSANIDSGDVLYVIGGIADNDIVSSSFALHYEG